MHDHTPQIGAFGSITAIGASMVATLEHVDLWLRVMTSGIGLIVGLLTLIYMARKLKGKHTDENH
jgi:hypothetical protein